MEQTNNDPGIEVPLGADGAIPAEALERVEKAEQVTTTEEVTVKVFNPETGKVEPQKVQQTRISLVNNGQFEYRLKPEYRVIEGKLYRQPTVNELRFDASELPPPGPLPQWVLDRMPKQ